MTITEEMYSALYKDSLNNNAYLEGHVCTRKIVLNQKMHVVYGIVKGANRRMFFVPVNSLGATFAYPVLEGMKIVTCRLQNYSDLLYLQIEELKNDNDVIFAVVVEDLRKNLSGCDEKSSGNCVITVLSKWKEFFSTGRSLKLSDMQEKGLFGELLFLKKLFETHGQSSVYYWCGAGKEPHDFYIENDAVEIKTTTMQAPYQVRISSAYQLDDSEVKGELFLRVYMLRRSMQDGDRLPDLVTEIRGLMEENSSELAEFDAKLRQYGYYDETSDEYMHRFNLRECRQFKVTEEFPRIIRSMVSDAIGDLEYTIVLSGCADYIDDREF